MQMTPDQKFFHPNEIAQHDVNIIGEWIIVRNIPSIRGDSFEHVIIHRCRHKDARRNMERAVIPEHYYHTIAYRYKEPTDRNACYFCDKPVPDEIKMIGILLIATP